MQCNCPSPVLLFPIIELFLKESHFTEIILSLYTKKNYFILIFFETKAIQYIFLYYYIHTTPTSAHMRMHRKENFIKLKKKTSNL